MTENKNKKLQVRKFAAAQIDRTLQNWFTTFQSFNEEIEMDLESLRSRSREASVNNPYLRRYFKALKTNVIGNGIRLRNTARNISGTYDTNANKKIENAWKEWSKHAGIDGSSLTEVSKLIIETVARDGEVLIIFRRGAAYGPYRFQLQVIEADHLDIRHNLNQGPVNMRNSVEMDELGRPIAYHIYKTHPADQHFSTASEMEKVRISAKDILHVVDKERAGQVRGFPWIPAALIELKHVDEYRKSELIASRVASAKSLWVSRPVTEDDSTLAGEEDPIDDSALTDELSPGTATYLPEGYMPHVVDFQNPNARFDSFTKVILRGAAASLGVSYHLLANDLESTSYSSLRYGTLDERETWKEIQDWFCEDVMNRVFTEWLSVAFSIGVLGLPRDRFNKFNAPEWRCRRWSHIDTAKESNAIKTQLETRQTSLTEVIRQSGRDREEVMQEIAEDQKSMEELGITFLLSNAEQPLTDDSEDDDN